MLSNRVYPSDYTDPYQHDPKAQCLECGDWFEAGDIVDVEEVTGPEYSIIYQGICLDCQIIQSEYEALKE